MYDKEKYDWETRDDADVLRRYQQIKSNPERLKKAQMCIADSVSVAVAVLRDEPVEPVKVSSRHNNKATLRRL